MPGFVEEINKPMSDESFKTYAGVIGFLMKKGVDVAAERFEKKDFWDIEKGQPG